MNITSIHLRSFKGEIVTLNFAIVYNLFKALETIWTPVESALVAFKGTKDNVNPYANIIWSSARSLSVILILSSV